jgi:hypothetical protein
MLCYYCKQCKKDKYANELLEYKVAITNPAEDDGLLRVIRIRSTLSLRGEPSVPCPKISLHVKEPFQILTKILNKAKIISFTSYSCFYTR